MIQYSNYKRFYVDSGIFNLSGASYTGYVEVLSGVPYVAAPEIYFNKCYSSSASTRQQLEKRFTYKTDVFCSDLFYDRIISDETSLPYTLNDILFDTNDFLNYELYRDKIKKLNENILYTYSRCFVVNNNLPYSTGNVKYACVSATSDTKLSVLTGFRDIPTFSSNINFLNLGNVKGFVAVNYLQDDDTSVIFAHTDTNFISISCTETSTSIIEISPFYETDTTQNRLKFASIGDIACVSNYLYITDTGNNTVVKYDISGYINNDSVLSNKRTIVEILGGKGTVDDKLSFNGPTIITASNSYIAVYDSNNRIIKVYDLDFNFVTRISGINLRSEQLLTMEYNKINNLLYVITKAANTVKLYIVNDSFTISAIYNLSINLKENELIKNIEFSFNDNNYFYICTTFNVYKCLINRPEYIVGRYNSQSLYTNVTDVSSTDGDTTGISNIWNYVDVPFEQADFTWNTGTVVNNTITQSISGTVSTLYNDTFKGYRITPQRTNYDKVFLFTTGKIYYFKEENVLNTTLKSDNYENFGPNNFTLSKDEYIQCSSLNKELYKVAYDTLNIKNNIVGRFTGTYDSNNVFTYSRYNYNIDFSVINVMTLDNLYIHENEKNILGVFNRSITRLYNLQLDLINLVKPDKGNGIVPVFTICNDSNNVVIIE